MDTLELTDPDVAPSDAVLARMLGESFSTYRRLLELFDENGISHAWRYYADGKAWLCKAQKKSRTIAWVSARTGYARATVYVPERHVEGLFGLHLPTEEEERIRGTRNVGKSRPCSYDIRTDEDLAAFEKVMRFKLDLR